MVNAWSLAASILNGTFDEDYPIVKKEVDEKTGLWKEPDPVEHSDAYYDYKRNDPDAENPFTDPKDRERADFVVGAGNTADLEWIEKSGGFEWTPGSPWPPSVPDEEACNGDEYTQAFDHLMNEDDGLDYEVNYYDDYMATVDDQYSHHFGQNTVPPHITTEFKYNENEILKIAEEYIAKTYTLHYTGKKGTQTLDLIESIGDAEAFCRSNAIKYLSRFGKKDGKSKSDLLKAIHYCTLLYHFSGLTNESIDSNETI
tara:strand:+ start:366 stop:1136 length:771 start_codon:yes stop_codon:yes gene_type:complete